MKAKFGKKEAPEIYVTLLKSALSLVDI